MRSEPAPAVAGGGHVDRGDTNRMASGGTPVQQGFLFAELGQAKAEATLTRHDPQQTSLPAGDGAAADPGSVPLFLPGQRDEWSEVGSLAELARLAEECQRCGLRRGCTHLVFGEGDPAAQVMFIGEGPGETEDQMGRPFVGRAGQLLDKILVASGFAREEVYIANAVKCRPPGNRQPTPAETAACLPWLEAQIRLIGPRFIVALGASAAQTLIDPKLRITAARGKWYDRNGVKCMPTFHPAALLRDPEKKRPVWEDMKKLRAEFEKQRSR